MQPSTDPWNLRGETTQLTSEDNAVRASAHVSAALINGQGQLF